MLPTESTDNLDLYNNNKENGDIHSKTHIIIYFQRFIRFISFLFIFFYQQLSPIFMYLIGFIGVDRFIYWGFKQYVIIFGIKFRLIGSEQLVQAPVSNNRHVIFLVNHRSFADFFVDNILTGYQSVYLSRLLVMLGAPFCAMVSYLSGSIWFFSRPKPIKKQVNYIKQEIQTDSDSPKQEMNDIKVEQIEIIKTDSEISDFTEPKINPNKKKPGFDREAFYNFLDNKRKTSVHHAILLYPEGTRNQTQVSLPLKKGALLYSFSRQLPVQIIIAGNKEKLLNEKKVSACFNITIPVVYSPLIDPILYDNFEDFYSAVQMNWDSSWNLIYSKDITSSPAKTSFLTSDSNSNISLDINTNNESNKSIQSNQEYVPPCFINSKIRWSPFGIRFSFFSLLFLLSVISCIIIIST